MPGRFCPAYKIDLKDIGANKHGKRLHPDTLTEVSDSGK
jgi:hypothetical protein